MRNDFFIYAAFYPNLELQWREMGFPGAVQTFGFVDAEWELDPFNSSNYIYTHKFEYTPTENTLTPNDKWSFQALRIDLVAKTATNTLEIEDSFGAVIPFVTTGPRTDNIEIKNTSPTPSIPLVVLHDPPGDQSFSSMMEGVEHCQTVSWSTASSSQVGVWAKAKVGTKISNSFLGLAEVETEVYASVQGSFSLTLNQNAAGETEQCFSTNNTFSTSADNNAINGERGDVFLGKSTLMSMGIAENISFQCYSEAVIKKELVIAPSGVAVEFAYTEDYIKNVLIPDLQEIMNNNSSGSNIFETAARQKEVWDQALAHNDAVKQGSVSKTHLFTAGADQSFSETVMTSEINTIETSMDIDMDLAIEAGIEIAGNGLFGGANIRMRTETGFGSGSSNNSTNTVSYTLSDGDNTTTGVGSDKFNVGVIHDAKYGTPAFVLLDGETSCPYEGGYQIDQPKLQYQDGSNTTSVMGEIGETVVVPVQICNDSKYERNYHLKLNNNTNSNGLLIDISGTTLNTTDEGHLFSSVPAEGCLDQNLIINSPADALTSFTGIEIYLYACSENTTTDGSTILSSVQLAVNFGEAAPDFDRACDAIALPTDGSLQGPFDNTLATAESMEDSITPPGTGCETQDGWCSEGLGIENSVWFTFTAPTSGKVEVSTCGLADFDTQLAVYEVANCSEFSAYNLVGANDDGPATCSSDYDSYLSLENLQPGQTYYVMVDGYFGQIGTFEIFVNALTSTSTKDIDLSSQVRVYPNPCSESITIKSENKYDNLQVYSFTGKLLLSIKDPTLINNGSPIMLPDLDEGMYIGILKTDQQTESFNFSVIKK